MRRLAIVLSVLSFIFPGLASHDAVRAETVLRVNSAALGTPDPANASLYADLLVMFNVYDTLILPAAGAPGHVPHLAKNWTSTDDSYTFELRDDVRFHSGNTLTADDVVFSFDRMRALKGELAYLFEPIDVVTAVGSHTVRFDLKSPYAAFLPALLRLPILDKTLIMQHLGDGDGSNGDWGRDYLSNNAAGSGAYRIDSRTVGTGMTLARNTDYFLDVPKAAPERVEISYGLTPDQESDRISKGTLDITSQWLPPEIIASLVKGGLDILTEPGAGGFYLKMNTQKPPLDDPQCRLAVSNAFDYDAALKLLKVGDAGSLGTAATGAIPGGMLGALPPSEVLKQDLTAAKQHLGSCRYDPGEVALDIIWIEGAPFERQFAELLKKNVEQLGMKTVLGAMTWASFTEDAFDPQTTPGISPVYDYSETGDIDALLYGMYYSDSGTGWQSAEHLDDRQVDALLEKGRTATGNHDRATAYRDLNRRLMALAPTVYVFDRISTFVVSDRVRVPALSDSASRFEVPGMGFAFRLMTMVPQEKSK